MSRRRFQPSARLGVLVVAALAGGCFEPAVQESFQLEFLSGGAAIVRGEVRLAPPDERRGNPALERRLAALRRALAAGDDPWSVRFARLEPRAERLFWEKSGGEIVRLRRVALLPDPRDLRPFFADTDLRVSYDERGEQAELAILTAPTTRATRRQQRDLERATAAWTDALAGYYERAAELWRYLDARPERGGATLGNLLSDLLSEEARATLPEPTVEEARLLAALEEAMEAVVDVLTVADGAELSIEELSRLAYDPFPAPLTVVLPADPLEVEGFARRGPRVLEAAGPSLWSALRALGGRWLAPDPVLLYGERREREQDPPLDLGALLAAPRHAEAAPAAEIRRAIEERLEPASIYRVAWPLAPGREPEGSFPERSEQVRPRRARRT